MSIARISEKGEKMKNYVLKNMFSESNGLFMCELPTGYGKTYTIVQVMKEYISDISNKKKIIYLTTLNKNLPVEELLEAFDGDKQEYNKRVLHIRSNVDEVIEKLEELSIPEEFQTSDYIRLIRLVKKYKHIKESEFSDKEYINDLRKKIEKEESIFRRNISKKLAEEYKTKSSRLATIKKISKWKWIGQLYPAVFTDESQILCMSVSKFLKRNSCIIEPSYEFLKAPFLNGAIIFIDEFDATKATIQSEIIERSLTINEEYIGLFRQIIRGLNPKFLSKGITDAYHRISKEGRGQYTFEKILLEGKEIEDKYHTNLSYKTAESAISKKQNFLLKDATYHTLFHNNKNYIRAAINNYENRIDIFFEDRAEFFAHKKESKQNIVIFGLLREINRFLGHFKRFLFSWAEKYMEDTNAERSAEDDAMTIDGAISSILKRLDLNEVQQKLILGELCDPIAKHSSKKELLPDNSFYQEGLELFELEDSDLHLENTFLRLVDVRDTPEKILLYLSEKAIVYGISATAELGSVIGNYDLNYLEEKLGNKYHATPVEVKSYIEKCLLENWKAYEDGRIQIKTEVIKSKINSYESEEMLKNLFNDQELAQYCISLIHNSVNTSYHITRYCNVVLSMCRFCKTANIQSFLYLGMALPKKCNPEFDQELIEKLFDLVRKDLSTESVSLIFLRSEGYDKDKEALIERLERGEKIYIMSSYQTIGAGQNLQYKAPDKTKLIELIPDKGDGDKRHTTKDIDAIYLGDVTNMTINTYKNERLSAEEFMEMLFQIEELRENDEFNFCETESMIKLAFQAYTTKKERKEINLLYNTKSVNLQANRHVMQAVGRMCRTFLKNPEIFLFIEEPLLEKLSVAELQKHILPPEMKALVKLREELGTEYSDDEKMILKKAENASSRGMWLIRQLLSRNWNDESMNVWRELRRIVLKYPTVNAKIRDENDTLRKLYITSGIPQNKYLFSQYSDFKDVTIDFGMDRIGFRNSGRAKRKANTDEVLVYEMSEEDSRLPFALKYSGMKEYFEKSGYATTFVANDYMMSPVLYYNIYKGALGEVAGSYILERELGISLSDITDPEKFEFFDYKMREDVYVDFKNWKFTYTQDRESIKKEISYKMDEIRAKRVYIINLIDSGEHVATKQIDERIIEIPGLIDENGKIIKENIRMIKEEDWL